MVSSTLCPAVHILGSQNVYNRAEGIFFLFSLQNLLTASSLFRRFL